MQTRPQIQDALPSASAGAAHAGGFIADTIGNTPMVRLSRLFPDLDVRAKLELFNPTHSVKDRPAFHILSSAEREGTLQPGATIVESSSGNFGLSVALYGSIRNHPVTCVVDPRLMPYFRLMYRILGVQMHMVDVMEEGSYQLCRIRMVKELTARIPGAYVPDQYDNPRNAEAHYLFTGGEMLRQMGEQPIDYLFLGVSTGGTLSGIARRVRERYPDCQVVAVDAAGSPLFDPCPRARVMTGLGSNYVSRNLDKKIISRVVLVSDLEATVMARVLLRQEGIFAGVSSGAVLAAIHKMQALIPPGKTVVTLFPDSGNRYIETFYNDRWIRKHIGVAISTLERHPGRLSDLVPPLGA